MSTSILTTIAFHAEREPFLRHVDFRLAFSKPPTSLRSHSGLAPGWPSGAVIGPLVFTLAWLVRGAASPGYSVFGLILAGPFNLESPMLHDVGAVLGLGSAALSSLASPVCRSAFSCSKRSPTSDPERRSLR